MLSENRRAQARSSSKKGKALGSFFERFILGIMAHFSMIIDSPREPQPLPERRRCVGAIREMITIAKEQVSIGLPQVRVTLY
jgi:serine/threonine-protein kinase ATR